MKIPEIDVMALGAMLQSDQEFVLLDIREPWELARGTWDDPRLRQVPLSQLSKDGVSILPSEVQDENVRIIVVCHHGVRSATVTTWLVSQGWTDVFSLRGGIEAYAVEIDSSVGRY